MLAGVTYLSHALIEADLWGSQSALTEPSKVGNGFFLTAYMKRQARIRIRMVSAHPILACTRVATVNEPLTSPTSSSPKARLDWRHQWQTSGGSRIQAVDYWVLSSQLLG